MRVIREVFIMHCQVFLPKDPVVVRKIVSTCHNLSYELTIIVRIRSVSKVVAESGTPEQRAHRILRILTDGDILMGTREGKGKSPTLFRFFRLIAITETNRGKFFICFHRRPGRNSFVS